MIVTNTWAQWPHLLPVAVEAGAKLTARNPDATSPVASKD
ncbi:unnamed protein product [Ciceribacter sp. T2.26MG-112.2]|nr:unnamed protein product [Ciceribacter naphthalenivorans]